MNFCKNCKLKELCPPAYIKCPVEERFYNRLRWFNTFISATALIIAIIVLALKSKLG